MIWKNESREIGEFDEAEIEKPVESEPGLREVVNHESSYWTITESWNVCRCHSERLPVMDVRNLIAKGKPVCSY